jgi:hypothetical protein
MPVFLQDAKFYCDLTKPFLVELDNDIARHAIKMETYKQENEERLKKLMVMLESCMNFGESERFQVQEVK